MPAIAGKTCVTMTHYIRTPRGVFTFTHYLEPVSPAATYGALLTRANAWFALISPLWAELATDSCTMDGVNAVQHDGAEYLDAFTDEAPVPGAAESTDSSTDMPDIIALVVQKRTGLAGRYNRGRIFVPGICEQANAGGLVSADFFEAAQNLAALLGADQTLDAVIHHARHWVRFGTDDLEVITHCRAMRELRTRRDREVRGVNLPIPASA